MPRITSHRRAITVNIELHERELEYLRELVCNYMGTDKESDEEADMRRELYETFNSALNQ